MQATYPDIRVMFARFLFHTGCMGNERKNETFSMKNVEGLVILYFIFEAYE